MMLCVIFRNGYVLGLEKYSVDTIISHIRIQLGMMLFVFVISLHNWRVPGYMYLYGERSSSFERPSPVIQTPNYMCIITVRKWSYISLYLLLCNVSIFSSQSNLIH